MTLIPARPRWPRRLFGLALLLPSGLLAQGDAGVDPRIAAVEGGLLPRVVEKGKAGSGSSAMPRGR